MGHELRRSRRLGQEVRQRFLGRRLRRAPVDRLRYHDADAHGRRVDRDEPEPALVGAGDHLNVAAAPPVAPGDAVVLAVNGDVLQDRISVALAETPGQESRASGRVDDRAHGDARLTLVRVDIGQGDAVIVEHRRGGGPFLKHDGATIRGVLEQNLVECRPGHLKGPRIRHLEGLREIRILIRVAVGGREAGAPLLNEPGGGDGFVRADSCEDLVNPRDLRFADVKTGETLALEDEDAAITAREDACRRGASRATSDDGDVKVPRSNHASG